MFTLLTNAEVLDCGNPDSLRYQVWAVATDCGDTSRVAQAHVCSAADRNTAEILAFLINTHRPIIDSPRGK